MMAGAAAWRKRRREKVWRGGVVVGEDGEVASSAWCGESEQVA
jgi:hypothetical protein